MTASSGTVTQNNKEVFMSIQKQLSQSASLLSAVDALRNWRAAALMLGTLVATMLLFAVGAMAASGVSWVFGVLFSLIAIAVSFYGANAVGLMVMDEARGGTSRPIMAAILTSLGTGHRLILLLLLVGLTYLAGLLVMAIVLLVCKIPVLGPVLFAFVFPVFVVVAGVAIFALYAVIFPLAAPAIWSGATTMQGLSRLAAIARQRIVVVVLSMTMLFLITAVVVFIIGGIMLAGTLVTGGLSASIIGVGGMGLAGMMGSMAGGGMGGYGGYGAFGGSGAGHLMAGAIGGGVVWAIALTLPALVYCRGCCQVYLANIDGVDVEGMEQQLRDRLDAAKRRAEEIKAKGEAMARAPAPAPAAPVSPVAPAAPVAPVAAVATPAVVAPAAVAPPAETAPPPYRCAVCGTPCLPGDVFCNNCGNKLA
jgi:hypothetical protein